MIFMILLQPIFVFYMNVIITGLPYFGKKISTSLNEVDKNNGLSFFVLESLLFIRYMIYNYRVDNCILAKNIKEIKTNLKELLEQFNSGILKPNSHIREYVNIEFFKENIYGLAKILTK